MASYFVVVSIDPFHFTFNFISQFAVTTLCFCHNRRVNVIILPSIVRSRCRVSQTIERITISLSRQFWRRQRLLSIIIIIPMKSVFLFSNWAREWEKQKNIFRDTVSYIFHAMLLRLTTPNTQRLSRNLWLFSGRR